jgi:hypothetical protein
MGRENEPRSKGRRRAPRRIVGAGTLLALVLTLALASVSAVSSSVAGAATAKSDQHTIIGYLSLQEAGGYFLGPCHGSGGYVDIDQGTPVTVRDESGDVIGEGKFGTGKPTGAAIGGKLGYHSACVFKFVVRNVPVSATYTFQVSKRGGLTYTYQELARSKWQLGAVLGD